MKNNIKGNNQKNPRLIVKKLSQAHNHGLHFKRIKRMRSYLAVEKEAKETTFLRIFLMAVYDLL